MQNNLTTFFNKPNLPHIPLTINTIIMKTKNVLKIIVAILSFFACVVIVCSPFLRNLYYSRQTDQIEDVKIVDIRTYKKTKAFPETNRGEGSFILDLIHYEVIYVDKRGNYSDWTTCSGHFVPQKGNAKIFLHDEEIIWYKALD